MPGPKTDMSLPLPTGVLRGDQVDLYGGKGVDIAMTKLSPFYAQHL